MTIKELLTTSEKLKQRRVEIFAGLGIISLVLYTILDYLYIPSITLNLEEHLNPIQALVYHYSLFTMIFYFGISLYHLGKRRGARQ